MKVLGWMAVLALGLASALAVGEDFIARNGQGPAEGLFQIQFEEPVAVGSARGSSEGGSSESRGPSEGGGSSGNGGQVQALSGLPATSMANLAALARAFLVQQGELLDLDGPGQLDLMRVTRDDYGGSHLRFARTYKGLLVDAMDLLVHFDAKARVTGINGNIVRMAPEVRDAMLLRGDAPALTAEAAQDFVAQQLGKEAAALDFGEPRPLLIAEAPYVIWELRVRDGLTPYRFRISDEPLPQVLVKDLDLRF